MASIYVRECGTPLRVVASGVGTIGAGRNVALLGIAVASVLTAQAVQLFSQTAGSTTGITVLGTMTLAANTFTPLPGYFALGLTYAVSNEDVDLTFFWNPAD